MDMVIYLFQKGGDAKRKSTKPHIRYADRRAVKTS
jgi:hypothetical protein